MYLVEFCSIVSCDRPIIVLGVVVVIDPNCNDHSPCPCEAEKLNKGNVLVSISNLTLNSFVSIDSLFTVKLKLFKDCNSFKIMCSKYLIQLALLFIVLLFIQKNEN